MKARLQYPFVASVILIAAGTSLRATTLIVTSLADGGAGSLRDQIAASSTGDSIQFSVSGTIQLSSAISITHSLNVQGPGPSALVVDANQVDRAFIISGSSTNVISGMTITNGLVVGAAGADGGLGQNGMDGGLAQGGAIFDQGNSLLLSNCWLVGNTVEGGPGGHGGSNVIGEFYFSPGNGGAGGGAAGGALYSQGNPSVINCTFSSNRAVGGTGGKGGTNVATSTAAGGTGGQGGGAFGGSVSASPAYCTNSTFSGNRSGGGQGGTGGDNTDGGPGGSGGTGGSGNGGGIAGGVVPCNFSSCTIVSNFAFAGVGGLGGNGVPTGPSGASGSGMGGGVVGYVLSCNNRILSTILADNFASTVDSNYYMAFDDLGYNFIGSDDYAPCPWGSTTQAGTVVTPIHPELGPLAQNGGGLPTHAPLYGGSPIIISPVIDQGISTGLLTDERGAPRNYDFLSIPNAPGGDGSDIGAFELGSADLGLGMVSNNAVLSWPAYYGDFTLQSATNLQAPNNWSDVPVAPVVVGTQLVVSNLMTNDRTFYRLIIH